MKAKYRKGKMKMKNSVLIIVGILLTVIAFLAIYHFETPPNVNKIDTIIQRDTLWKDTAITDTVFQPKYIIKKKVDTLYTKGGDTLHLVTEQKMYEKSIVSDKDTADLKLYVSGINTALDSIKLHLKTHSVTNTVEITKYIERKRTFLDHFKIGVGVGYGIGLNSKQFEPFVGISLNYNF